jgi:hypothetical protein
MFQFTMRRDLSTCPIDGEYLDGQGKCLMCPDEAEDVPDFSTYLISYEEPPHICTKCIPGQQACICPACQYVDHGYTHIDMLHEENCCGQAQPCTWVECFTHWGIVPSPTNRTDGSHRDHANSDSESRA